MFFQSSRLLPLVVIQIIRQSTAQSSTILPQSLAYITPACAISCLDSIVSSGYRTSCHNSPNLNCLCTHTTSTGFTLGEVAVQCLAESCQAHDLINATSIYNICSGVEGAIVETIATMTVVITATTPISVAHVAPSADPLTSTFPASILVSTSFTGVSSLVFDSGTPPVPSPTGSITSSIPTSNATFSLSSLMSLTVQSSTTTYISQPASQSSLLPAHTSSKSKLSIGQIVGLAIGGFAILCLAIGFILAMFCIRRKNKNRRWSQRWSRHLEKHPPRTPPSRPNPVDSFSNPNIQSDFLQVHSQRFYASPPMEQNGNSDWRRSIDPEQIGIAVSPEGVEYQHSSPNSFSSQRTTSQLLPAMPVINLWPDPLKTRRSLIPDKQSSGPDPTSTVQEDPFTTSRAPQIIMIPPPESNFDFTRNEERGARRARESNIPAVDPRAQMYALERGRKPVTTEPIPLTPTYDNGNPTPDLTQGDFQRWKSPAPETRHEFIPPVPAIRYSTFQMPNLQRSNSRSQPDFGVRGPTNNPAWHSVPSNLPTYPPPARREPEPANNVERRPIPVRRSSSRYSSGSEATSFEIDDEITPEQEGGKRLQQPILSPVIESPNSSRPTFPRDIHMSTQIRYPPIPRPASISKQAEETHWPKASIYVDATGDQPQRPTRDQLVRNNESFLTSISTSSGGSNPSLLAKRRGDQAAGQMLQGGLKLNSDLVNGQGNKHWKVTHTEKEQKKPQLFLDTSDKGIENNRLSTRNSVGLTPTKRGNDLFLTVS